MSKELQALERIETFLKENCKHYKQDVGYIKQALTRLESIDNAKPSEALEDLDKMANQVFQVDDKFELYYNKVKQHILKAQEQEKVLSIIKETKNIKVSFYENGSGKHYKLEFDRTRNQTITEQEYDLLKRWLG